MHGRVGEYYKLLHISYSTGKEKTGKEIGLRKIGLSKNKKNVT